MMAYKSLFYVSGGRINMDLTHWKNLHNENKFKTFQDYVNDKLSCTQDFIDWLNWIAVMMAEKIRSKSLIVIRYKLQTLTDERYLHQLRELENLLQKLERLLDKKQPNPLKKNFPCSRITFSSYKLHSTSTDKQRCYHFTNNTVYKGTTFCFFAFSNIEEWSTMLLDKFMSYYVSNMYYVLKLKLSIFPHNIQFPPFSNLEDWEVVCEDDDHQLLSHPLLPHPRDFLTHKKCEGNLFVDKAKFEYYMEGSLHTYNVVLTNSPSPIPKLSPTIHGDEKVILTDKKETTLHQSLYHENTNRHRSGKNKPKKLLSRILKETRKKKKTRRLHPPSRPEASEHEFDPYYGDFIGEHPYDSDSDSDYGYDDDDYGYGYIYDDYLYY